MDSVASGAIQYLSGITDITNLLGKFAADDPNVSFRGQPYLFNDNLIVTLKGTSQIAFVLSDYGGWGLPMPLTTPRYSRLSVEIYVDPHRDAGGQVTETGGIVSSRGMSAWFTVDKYLHRTSGDSQIWGDVVATTCQRLTSPQFTRLPDGDGMLRGQAFYGVNDFGFIDSTF